MANASAIGINLMAPKNNEVAEIINDALIQKKLDKFDIILCGGGRRNKFLLERLRSEISFKLIDEYGVNGDFVESQAFAYLAIRSFLGLPISFPETTDVKEPCAGGKLIKY